MDNSPEAPESSGQRREVLNIDLPGIKIRITDQTLRTIMEFTGSAWRWVVYAVAAAIFVYSVGYTWASFKQ